jgi:hypothetical protein
LTVPFNQTPHEKSVPFGFECFPLLMKTQSKNNLDCFRARYQVSHLCIFWIKNACEVSGHLFPLLPVKRGMLAR